MLRFSAPAVRRAYTHRKGTFWGQGTPKALVFLYNDEVGEL